MAHNYHSKRRHYYYYHCKSQFLFPAVSWGPELALPCFGPHFPPCPIIWPCVIHAFHPACFSGQGLCSSFWHNFTTLGTLMRLLRRKRGKDVTDREATLASGSRCRLPSIWGSDRAPGRQGARGGLPGVRHHWRGGRLGPAGQTGQVGGLNWERETATRARGGGWGRAWLRRGRGSPSIARLPAGCTAGCRGPASWSFPNGRNVVRGCRVCL